MGPARHSSAFCDAKIKKQFSLRNRFMLSGRKKQKIPRFEILKKGYRKIIRVNIIRLELHVVNKFVPLTRLSN